MLDNTSYTFTVGTHSNVPTAAENSVEWQEAVEQARESLARPQQRQKAFAAQKQCDVTFAVRDELLLLLY